MVKIDDRRKSEYVQYIERHRRFEIIDCAIIQSIGKIFEYVDNGMGLITNSTCQVKSREFETDLTYLSKDRRAILFIEETADPTEKTEQLIKYGNVSSESLRLINRADLIPSVDVFVVFPQKHREIALSIYEDVKGEVASLGRDRGISLWYYTDQMKSLKCAGGSFSQFFPKEYRTELLSKGFGAFKIFKFAPPIFILQFLVIKALESDYGKTGDNIDFDRQKLSLWLSPYGIIKEERWREALLIGQTAGWISNFSSEQLTGSINYTKVNPKSLGRSRQFLSDFFKATEVKMDEKQQKLDFFIKEEGDDEIDENEDL